MSRPAFLLLATAIMGPAAMSAPLLAQAAQNQAGRAQSYLAQPAPASPSNVLPADTRDFECFVLLQQRRSDLVAATDISPDQRATLVNNLTIISAYYAGRISHYPGDQATAQFSAGRARIEGASLEQRGAAASSCADFYLSVMEVLDTRGGEAIAAQR